MKIPVEPDLESLRNHQKSTALILLAIILLGLGLRLHGIRFGLPYLYHVDEPSYVIAAVRLGNGVLASRPYDPTGFSNILFAEYGFYFVFGRLTGIFHSIQDFTQYYESDPSSFYLISRLTSALLGTVTIFLIYVIGRLVGGKRVGIAAAFLLALCFLHIRDSHYGTPDITMTFFATLSIALMLGVQKTTNRKYLTFFAGVAGGLAVATKWLALPILFSIILGSLTIPQKRTQNLLRSCGGFLLGFGLGSFQILINPAPYIGKVLVEFNRSQSVGYEGWYIDQAPSWLFYLKTLSYGVGIPLLLLGIVGAVLYAKQSVQKRKGDQAIILVFVFSYLAVIIPSSHFFARYALALLPFLALFAAQAGLVLAESLAKIALKRFYSSLVVYTLIGLLLCLTSLPSLARSFRHNYLLTVPDTRTLAKEWIELNIPAGTRIAVDWSVYAPPLFTGELVVPWVPPSDKIYKVTSMQYDYFLHSYSLDWYRESGFEYLITSSFIANLEFVSNEEQVRKELFYRSLNTDFDLVRVFSPYEDSIEPPWVYNEIYGPATYLWRRENPGPTIKIYQVDQ
jgi:hypothetical protein